MWWKNTPAASPGPPAPGRDPVKTRQARRGFAEGTSRVLRCSRRICTSDAQPCAGRGERVLDRAAVGAAVLGQHDAGIGEIAGAKRGAHLSRAGGGHHHDQLFFFGSLGLLLAAVGIYGLLVTGAVTALAALTGCRASSG